MRFDGWVAFFILLAIGFVLAGWVGNALEEGIYAGTFWISLAFVQALINGLDK